MIALTCGCLIEAVGYIGRVIMHHNPYSDLGFKMQICCLIMGPAFLAAGIYLTLKHVVKAFGRQYSFLRPKLYTWIFISCDVFSLTLQAVGGGLASSAEDSPSQLNTGNNFAISGIIIQVVTLVIFATLATLYFFRRNQQKATHEALESQLQTLRFKLFCGAVVVAFLTIFTRCVYRIAEMQGGWGNPLMQNEREFIILDSVMCAIAAVALTIFHPGYCFPQMAVPLSDRKAKRSAMVEQKASDDLSDSSDVDVERRAGETIKP
ncbi:MAG: hypothetical protein M1812_007358 [Candelaria pacifica]|nr:MAG: hypothetical protein M1812_007358 [Candelaria pacifica]